MGGRRARGAAHHKEGGQLRRLRLPGSAPPVPPARPPARPHGCPPPRNAAVCCCRRSVVGLSDDVLEGTTARDPAAGAGRRGTGSHFPAGGPQSEEAGRQASWGRADAGCSRPSAVAWLGANWSSRRSRCSRALRTLRNNLPQRAQRTPCSAPGSHGQHVLNVRGHHLQQVGARGVQHLPAPGMPALGVRPSRGCRGQRSARAAPSQRWGSAQNRFLYKLVPPARRPPAAHSPPARTGWRAAARRGGSRAAPARQSSRPS